MSITNERPGLRYAVTYLRQPIRYQTPANDIILDDYIEQISHDASKLQTLRMRLGYAWETIFTDIGFVIHDKGFDLINPTRKIALELKNGYRTNSIVLKSNIKALQTYKRNHPEYQVIVGFINYKNNTGKTSRKGDVTLLYGDHLINRFFTPNDFDNIQRHLKLAVQSHFQR